MTNNFPDFRNPQVAFESAISKGTFTEEHAVRVLCNLQKETNFVGDWMYMHSDKTKKIDYFKNKLTRKYKEVKYVWYIKQ